MRKIPVIALKNKSKENRFLAANMDVEEWLKYYEPIHLEITEEQFEIAKDNAEL